MVWNYQIKLRKICVKLGVLPLEAESTDDFSSLVPVYEWFCVTNDI